LGFADYQMWEFAMRGDDVRTENLFSYLSCEARVPREHPLRPIRTIVDQALTVLSPAFDQLYSDIGRPSIPPEKLLRALQPAVPLVCRPGDRRADLGCHGVHQEPRPVP
jgi:hypothetical protein